MANELRIILHGRPASKKNSKQIIHARGRSFIVPSKAYEAFKQYALYELLVYKRHLGKPIDKEVTIEYKFYQKGKMTQDHDNAEASINDVLQAAGILADDKLIKHWSGEIIGGANEWRTQIHIIW